MTRLGGRRGLTALFLFSAILLSGCARRAGPRSLLLITIDTCRADRLGAYGYTAAKTPHIDRLAAEGTLYSRAYAVVPETLPSHTSILTGLYPPSHGVRGNGIFRVPLDVTTLAEILRDQGFDTAAVIAAAVLDRRYGLDQGFATYDDPRLVGRRVRHADQITERAIAAMATTGERPFFLWVHYYDPHNPYEPPAPFDAGIGSGLQGGYDGEIAYVDHSIGKLLDELRNRHLMEDTLVILTADHGEGLGDHGESYHTLFVYDATIHVPLILAGPGVAAGERIDEVVSSVDIFSTALDLLGAPAPPTSSRVLPGLAGSRRAGADGSRSAYSESAMLARRYGWSSLQSVRTSDWLYIKAPREEIYRLDGSDRGQLYDLAFENRRQVLASRRVLDRALDSMPDLELGESARHLPSQEERDALAALGYLGGPRAVEAQPVSSGPDPKDMVEVAEAIQVAIAADLVGKLSVVEEQLSWAAMVDPENFAAWYNLGKLHRKRGDLEKSVDAFERALEILPSSPQVLTDLAAAEHKLGRLQAAEAHFEAALEKSVFPAQIWGRWGLLRREGKDWAGAAEAFRRSLAIQPENPVVQEALRRLEAGGW